MEQVILKRFEVPDEIISFEKGRFEKITWVELPLAVRLTSLAGNGRLTSDQKLVQLSAR